MKPILFLSLAAILSFFAQELVGQAPKPQVSEQMKALSFMHGEWEGKVKYEPGVGAGHEVFWSVHAYNNRGGSLLLIDEKEVKLNNQNQSAGQVFIVISWDSSAKFYPVRLHYSDGTSSEARGHLEGGSFIMQTTDTTEPIRRYKISVKGKEWHVLSEVAEGSGGRWKRRFEMLLYRKD